MAKSAGAPEPLNVDCDLMSHSAAMRQLKDVEGDYIGEYYRGYEGGCEEFRL